MDYAQLITENVNPDTVDIDLCDTEEIVNMIHREDCKVAPAVGKVLPEIAKTVDMVVERIRAGSGSSHSGGGHTELLLQSVNQLAQLQNGQSLDFLDHSSNFLTSHCSKPPNYQMFSE